MKKNVLYTVTTIYLIVFSLILFSLIFSASGTLFFIQGWIFGLSFCVSTFIITFYFLKKDPALIERRIKPVETRTKQIIGQSVAALLFFGGIIILPAIDYRLEWTSVPFWMSVLADIVAIAGFALVFRVFQVNTFSSRAIEVMDGQHVIRTGPYAIVRHPMYSGAAMIIVATPAALDSLTGLIPAIFLVIVIMLRILDEEKMLADGLNDYEDYCHQTKYRLIPYVW